MNTRAEINGGRRRRVFLVDHFPISRTVVAEWLKETRDLVLCGQADNVESALASIGRLKPDVVVTEIIRQQDLGFILGLRSRYPRLPILVFSFRDEDWYAPRALEAGADGFVEKGVDRSVLVEGIRGTLVGRVVLSPAMSRLTLKKALHSGTTSKSAG